MNWLKRQNINLVHERFDDQDTFKISGAQQYHPFEITLPGDYSSASTFLAAGALLPGEIQLKALDPHDAQGDKRLLEILVQMGADLQISHDSIVLKGGKPLQGITIDANEIPDLLPTLAVLGTKASGKTQIINVPKLDSRKLIAFIL